MSATVSNKRKMTRQVKGVVKEYSDGSILLERVRVSYPWVGKPQKNVNEKTGEETFTYGLSAMLDKETHAEAMKACRNAIRAMEKQMTTKGKGKAGRPFKYAGARKFIKDADLKDDDTGESRYFPNNPEYEGNWIVTCRSPNPPLLRGARKDPETGKVERITPAQAQRLIFGGCYCSVMIRPWPQDNQYGIRANAELVMVQFKAKGEAFGNNRRLDDDDIDDSVDVDDDDDDVGGWGDDDDDDM